MNQDVKKLNGFLVLNKPVGITSNKALSILKRTIGRKQKVGHLGTLDPLANGVLPVALGEATKAIPYIQNNNKVYRIVIKWGEQISTDDTEGEVIKTSDKRPVLSDVEAIIPNYLGEIKQTPPDFSACKIDGKRAYDLAREGKEVKIKAKDVRIDNIEILHSDEDTMELKVFCSKGTYMRSLARDLGEDLGCYGHCLSIERAKSGDFDISDSVAVDSIEEIDVESKLLSIADILDYLPTVELTLPKQEKRLRNGLEIEYAEGHLDLGLALFERKEVALVKSISPSSIRAIKVFNL